jgi:hypothetical protein
VASFGDPRVRDFLAHGTRTGKVLANFDITS